MSTPILILVLAFGVSLAISGLCWVASRVLDAVVWVNDRRLQRARAANAAARARYAAARAAREAEREALVQEMLARGLTRIEIDALIIVATAQVALLDGASDA